MTNLLNELLETNELLLETTLEIIKINGLEDEKIIKDWKKKIIKKVKEG